jgi:hypothetical protein
MAERRACVEACVQVLSIQSLGRLFSKTGLQSSSNRLSTSRELLRRHLLKHSRLVVGDAVTWLNS